MSEKTPLSPIWRRTGFWGLGAALLALISGGVYSWADFAAEKPAYRLAKVARGDIRSVVSASGSLRPLVSVQVGSQVSGKISELLVDFNAPVRAGQVIGRLDPAAFEAKVWQAEADLKVARANIAMQEASRLAVQAEVEAARSNLRDSTQDYGRKKELLARRVVAQSVVDKAIAAREQAKARLDGATARSRMQEAQVAHARAMVDEKQAALRQRQLDLSYTVIRSPVDGVVINRNVDVGQTVAASLQAPTLFTIAQDLRKMQVEVSVDEADIGRVREGQDVSFTVDAFPDREFAGKITQIRKAPTEIQNVVTYTVIVGAENPNFRLLPGMTANVSMVVGERRDVLKIDNAALRFRPPGASRRVDAGGKGQDTRVGKRPVRETKPLVLSADQEDRIRADRASRDDGRSRDPGRRGMVWIVDGTGGLRPIEVRLGMSDGTATELLRGDLAAGQPVIVGKSRRPESASRSGLLRF